MIVCQVCGKGMNDMVTLIPIKVNGENVAWRCLKHNEQPIHPDVKSIIDVIENDSK